MARQRLTKAQELELKGPRSTINIKALAQVHSRAAIDVLAGIMLCDTQPPFARIAAATALLDRGFGRPHLSIDVSGQFEHYVIRVPAPTQTAIEWQNQYSPPTAVTKRQPN